MLTTGNLGHLPTCFPWAASGITVLPLRKSHTSKTEGLKGDAVKKHHGQLCRQKYIM
jgi:hypothetical protein